jgi:hypothetical protein
MTFRRSDRRRALAIALACLATTAAKGQAMPSTAAQLEYRNVPFTAHRIDRDDPRFLVTEAGFPLVGGFSLRSRDPALYSISWYAGLMMSGSLRDGRAFVFHLPIAIGGEEGEIRVARTAELAGGWLLPGGRDEAPAHPEIPGYRFVMSDNVLGTSDYLGLWRRIGGGAPETLIVGFRIRGGNPNGHFIIGRWPLFVASISVHSPAHGVSWEVDLVSEAPVGEPIFVMHYQWFPAHFLHLPGTGSEDPREVCRMVQASRNRARP